MIRYIAPISLAGLIIILMALIFTLPTRAKATPSEAVSATVIKNVRIVTDGGLSESVSMLIEDGIISRIGDLRGITAETAIDGEGLIALPGLIDSHTHTYGTALEDAARFGVTALLDMMTDARGLDEILAARDIVTPTPKADLFSAGLLATAPGGHGTQFGVPIETLTSPEQAPAWVAARKAEGSDYIKLVYIPENTRVPSLGRDTARAVINAGHAEGLMVVAHISTYDAAEAMIADGIDGLVHIFADRLVDENLLSQAKAREVFIVPTLSILASLDGGRNLESLASEHLNLLSQMQSQTAGASFGPPVSGYSLDIALKNVEALHKAGVDILAGSDAPNPGTAHGLSLHYELQLLVRAGLTPAEALNAATSIPAGLFGLEGRGVLKAGARADIILIEGDLTEDIGATLNIRHIFKNGHLLDRTVPETPAGGAVSNDLFGDFETGLSSIEGFEWVVSTDAVAGGTSEGTISRFPDGAQGTSHALKVEMSVKSGFPYPWSGASVALSQTGSIGPIDLSGYTSLSFDMKGSPGTYRVMGFDAGAGGIPPTQTVDITQTWQTYELELEDFSGLAIDNFTGFAFVAGPAFGDSTIYLDNVKLVK